MEKRYLTFNELAFYIGVAVKTLRNWKTSTPERLPPHVELPSDGVHDIWRFDVVEVDAWMRRKRNGNEQAVGL